jgi:trehalose synthase
MSRSKDCCSGPYPRARKSASSIWEMPLPLIRHYRKNAPWIWRCHIDLSAPNMKLWEYLRSFVERYDAVVLSVPEYAQKLEVPQRFIMPAINPFSTTNKELSEKEITDRLAHYGAPDDLPLVVQVSRFDKWKDPQGVIDAFRSAQAGRLHVSSCRQHRHR